MGLGLSGPEAFIRDPGEMRFYCQVFAKKAGDGPFSFRRAYQVLRAMSAHELYDVYQAYRDDGNEGLFKAISRPYYEKAGESAEGPLFDQAM